MVPPTASVNQSTEATRRIDKAAKATQKAAESLIKASELFKRTLENL